MEETKTKIQSLGFTSGHLKLLTVAFVVIGGLIFAKSGLNIKTMFVKADNETQKQTITYEQAKAEVEAENPPVDSSTLADSDAAQIALIDRGDVDGQVLGDAIGIGAIPDADQLVIPDITSQIHMTMDSQDDDKARLQYETTTQGIEADADIVGLLSDLNSSDQSALDHSVKGWGWVIDTLQNTPVPPSLAEFHKNKIAYYSVVMNIGKIYAGQKSDSDLQLLTKAMLSYSQKIEDLRTTINDTYKLNL